MTALQRLQVRASQIRERLNELSGLDDLTEEQRTELDTLTAEYSTVEAQTRAAVIAESRTEADEAVEAGEDTPEGREIRELIQTANLGTMIVAASGHGRIEEGSAEAELRQASGIEAVNEVPWAAFLDAEDLTDTEDRADVVTNLGAVATGVNQRPIMARLFHASVTRFLGVGMPSVGTGSQLWPYLQTGTTAAMKQPSAKIDSAAATLQTVTTAPTRLTSRYVMQREDLLRLSGVDAALRRDIRSAMADQMDQQILNGNGAAPNVTGLLNAGGLAALADPTETVTWQSFLEDAIEGVDGLVATGMGELSLLIGTETYRKVEALFPATDTLTSAMAYVQSRGVSTRATGHIAAGAIQEGILVKARGKMEVQAPVWSGVQIVTDEVSLVDKGQIAMTALSFWDLVYIRKAYYGLRRKFKLN